MPRSSLAVAGACAVIACLAATCWGSPRILGGYDGDIADLSYMVSIERADSGHYCGGVVLSAQWALTDAWCATAPVLLSEWSMRVGSAFLGNGSAHNVSRWVHHPQSDVVNGVFDLALLEASPPFSLGVDVGVVALPTSSQASPAAAVGIFAGWGEVTGSDDWTTDRLQVADMTVFSDDACALNLAFDYEESKLCAESNASVCLRDEGGPLVVEGVVFGVALWPGTCGDQRPWYVFARVSVARDWIQDITGL